MVELCVFVQRKKTLYIVVELLLQTANICLASTGQRQMCGPINWKGSHITGRTQDLLPTDVGAGSLQLSQNCSVGVTETPSPSQSGPSSAQGFWMHSSDKLVPLPPLMVL